MAGLMGMMGGDSSNSSDDVDAIGAGIGGDFFAAADISILVMAIIPLMITMFLGEFFLWVGLKSLGDLLYYGPIVVIVILIGLALMSLLKK